MPLSQGELVRLGPRAGALSGGHGRDPLRANRVKRKDVYSDSVSILQQVGLL
jgi:hypothetical protein